MHADFIEISDPEWERGLNEIRELRQELGRLFRLSDGLGRFLEKSEIERRKVVERDRQIFEMSQAGASEKDLMSYFGLAASQICAVIRTAKLERKNKKAVLRKNA